MMAITKDALIRLHDATFASVHIDWADGSAELRLLVHKGKPVVLRAEGLKLINVPKREPWGPSVSVNEIRGPIPADDGLRMEIELQSGDTVAIDAEGFSLV